MTFVKRNHFVPISLLERFTDSDGKLWVYDKSEDKWFKTNPINVGVDKGIYDQDVEHWLAKEIEGPAISTFRRLDSGMTEISEDELHIIAKFIAVQRVRVRAIEKYVEMNDSSLVRDKLEETFYELAGDYGVEMGSILLDQVGCEPYEFLEHSGLRNLCNLALHGAMSNGNFEIAESMVDMAWRIICPNKGAFIVTDNPVAIGVPNKKNELPECVLPISTDKALHLGLFGRPRALNAVIQDDRLVRRLNSRILAASLRFVYSSKQERWVNKSAYVKVPYHPPLTFDAPFIPDEAEAT